MAPPARMTAPHPVGHVVAPTGTATTDAAKLVTGGLARQTSLREAARGRWRPPKIWREQPNSPCSIVPQSGANRNAFFVVDLPANDPRPGRRKRFA
jgi:hypothetical protein